MDVFELEASKMEPWACYMLDKYWKKLINKWLSELVLGLFSLALRSLIVWQDDIQLSTQANIRNI